MLETRFQRWWLALASGVAVSYACIGVVSQFCDTDVDNYKATSISQWGVWQQSLPAISNILELERLSSPLCASGRNLDLILPQDTRVYMSDMLGQTNQPKAGMFVYLTYFLFPREIAVSVDRPAQLLRNGFEGRPPRSVEEAVTNGYQVLVDTSQGDIKPRFARGLALKPPANPEWFHSKRDTLIAFLLPLLTALAGLWLLGILSPGLYQKMPFLEKLACSLGLGAMAVSALTLGMKLCGFHGRGVVLFVSAAGALTAIWNNRRAVGTEFSGGLQRAIQSPVVMLGALIFLIIFRLAGEIGLLEFDAVAAWALKAKIFYLYTGSEIVRWFSEPRLAHAHLDYPTLVPCLHAATYDSIGHVNEFVIKFWYAWMLLFLITGLGSITRGWKGRIAAPGFFLLALVLMPLTRKFVQWDGATLPLMFFTVLGIVECTLWQLEGNPARLVLGLLLLFGAAMVKFEGAIFLAAVLAWALVLPWCRRSIGRPPLVWRAAVFCILAALPFAALRSQIPVLDYESHWASYALRHPVVTASHWPAVFMVTVSKWFVSPRLSAWNGEGGHLHWAGQWEGLSSLYYHPTLGLAWFCLVMTLALWLAVPPRRTTMVWLFAVIASSVAALAVVFSSFVAVDGLTHVMSYTDERNAQRYLFPLLLGWAITVMLLLFVEEPVPAPSSSTSILVPADQIPAVASEAARLNNQVSRR
jgi:hypothetical protein